jgi:hypothetical protein
MGVELENIVFKSDFGSQEKTIGKNLGMVERMED